MVRTAERQNGWSALWLACRSVAWTIAMPGVVAGYVPWRIGQLDRVGWRGDAMQVVGVLLAAIGAALLATCIWEFAWSGRGTLSPVDPPRELVVRGLYRYVRNPMYFSVTTIVLGEAAYARSLPLVWYWLAFFTAANLFVIGYEEPNLRRRFGESYGAYTSSVGRWIPGRR